MAQRFRFRLESVLRVREIREREALRKFGAAQAEIALLDRVSREIAEQVAREQGALLAAQSDGRIDTAALTRQRAWIAHLRRTLHERSLARLEMVRRLDALRTAFQRARTDRRALQLLRERRFAAHAREQNRRDQLETDELARNVPRLTGIEPSDGQEPR